jgi:hypothetical protein
MIALAGTTRLGLSLPLYAVILGTGTLSHADTYWHIAAGRWIIANGAAPHQDMFSFSMAGAPWTSPEWLAETVFAWLYERFGWAGPIEATALSFALALGLLLRSLLRSMAPVYALIATVLACGLTLKHLLARPHTWCSRSSFFGWRPSSPAAQRIALCRSPSRRLCACGPICTAATS